MSVTEDFAERVFRLLGWVLVNDYAPALWEGYAPPNGERAPESFKLEIGSPMPVWLRRAIHEGLVDSVPFAERGAMPWGQDGLKVKRTGRHVKIGELIWEDEF